MKTVFFDAPSHPHLLFRSLLQFPPDGYRFLTPGLLEPWVNQPPAVTLQASDKLPQDAGPRTKLSSFLFEAKGLVSTAIDSGRPLVAASTYIMAAKLKYRGYWPFKTNYRPRVGEPYDLTYSANRMDLRKEPWVAGVEYVGSLCPKPYDELHLPLYKSFIEKVLRSTYCKKVMPWSRAGEQTIRLNLDCREFEEKIETVDLAIPSRKFDRKDDGVVNLLFLGTVNLGTTATSFEVRGGRVVIEAYKLISQRYDRVRLTIRCSVPKAIRELYRQFFERKDVNVVDQTLPEDEFVQLMASADVLLHPTFALPGLTFLEAMSFGLPIITTDGWGNKEFVEDGVNGLIIPRSANIAKYAPRHVPFTGITIITEDALRAEDHQLPKDLATAAGRLIEDASLRDRMGREGRKEIEVGRFSIQHRNKKLREIFADALGG